MQKTGPMTVRAKFNGSEDSSAVNVLGGILHIWNRDLLSALRGDQFRDHVGSLLSAIRRLGFLPFPNGLKHRSAERLHEFAGEIVGLTVVQRHRAIDLRLEGSRNLAN